jgi:uncharacterized protein (UPF0335 family)
MNPIEFYRTIPSNLLINLGFPLDYHQLTLDQKELFSFIINDWLEKEEYIERINELEDEYKQLREENLELNCLLEDLKSSALNSLDAITETVLEEKNRIGLV